MSQVPLKLRSTLSIGSSNTISSKENKYHIEQSIGQTSVTGAYKSVNYILLQGFIQPSLVLYTSKENRSNTKLEASLYPSSFSDNVTVSFSDKISSSLLVDIDDLLGRIVFSKKYSASQDLNLDLGFLPSGLYIIRINADEKYFISKLVKK